MCSHKQTLLIVSRSQWESSCESMTHCQPLPWNLRNEESWRNPRLGWSPGRFLRQGGVADQRSDFSRTWILALPINPRVCGRGEWSGRSLTDKKKHKQWPIDGSVGSVGTLIQTHKRHFGYLEKLLEIKLWLFKDVKKSLDILDIVEVLWFHFEKISH